MTQREAFNPFYVLLLAVGVLFLLTACCYGVLAFRERDPAMLVEAAGSGRGLLAFMDHYGVRLMLIELSLLGLATVGAIATDGFWTRRARRKAEREAREKSGRSQGEVRRMKDEG